MRDTDIWGRSHLLPRWPREWTRMRGGQRPIPPHGGPPNSPPPPPTAQEVTAVPHVPPCCPLPPPAVLQCGPPPAAFPEMRKVPNIRAAPPSLQSRGRVGGEGGDTHTLDGDPTLISTPMGVPHPTAPISAPQVDPGPRYPMGDPTVPVLLWVTLGDVVVPTGLGVGYPLTNTAAIKDPPPPTPQPAPPASPSPLSHGAAAAAPPARRSAAPCGPHTCTDVSYTPSPPP